MIQSSFPYCSPNYKWSLWNMEDEYLHIRYTILGHNAHLSTTTKMTSERHRAYSKRKSILKRIY